MNKERRKLISKLIVKLMPMQAEIEGLQEEEQEYYNNMPEGIQDSEKGQAAQDAADSLGEAAQAIESAIEYLTTSTE
jgi:hypothetical protein